MKQNIHPQYQEIEVVCSCGNKFVTKSTSRKQNIHIEVCSSCHPFYSGTHRVVDTEGNVEKFKQRFGNKSYSKALGKAAQ